MSRGHVKRNTRLTVVARLAVGILVATSVPAVAHVRPPSSLLPDGDTRPVIHSAELLTPAPHNSVLEADLVIEAFDNDRVTRYEYRWNSATYGSIHTTSASNPVVSYRSTRPNTPYALEVRAVDLHSNGSEWASVWSGTTPSVPRVIVAGDSVASGYTKTLFLGSARCTNRELSYGSAVTEILASTLPDAWAPEYVNIAWAGAGIEEFLSPGRDSCGVTHDAQADTIGDLANPETWNIVVITAGINSTNWDDVLVDLTRDTAFSFTKESDRKACVTALKERWNLGERAEQIDRELGTVVDELTSGTNASLFWTGYYDIAGTLLAPLWSPIGLECNAEMNEAMDDLHGVLRAGLSSDVHWVDINEPIQTQPWAGWPHPNAHGHQIIGRIVADAIAGA